jgi:hypothetical protein
MVCIIDAVFVEIYRRYDWEGIGFYRYFQIDLFYSAHDYSYGVAFGYSIEQHYVHGEFWRTF